MISQRCIAVRAAQNMSTVAAKNIGRGAASVQEHDGLFAAPQRGLKFLKQEPAEDPTLTRFQFIPHINNLDRR